MMAFWLGLPPWVRTAAMWTGAIILAVITGKLIIARHDDRIIKEERLRADLESAKERAAIKDAGTKAIEDIHDAQDAARVAPDRLPEFGSADILREQEPAISGVILRPSRVEHGSGS